MESTEFNNESHITETPLETFNYNKILSTSKDNVTESENLNIIEQNSQLIPTTLNSIREISEFSPPLKTETPAIESTNISDM